MKTHIHNILYKSIINNPENLGIAFNCGAVGVLDNRLNVLMNQIEEKEKYLGDC